MTLARSSTTPSGLPTSNPAALRRWGPRAWGPRFVLLAISLSIVLLTSFAAPPQAPKGKSRAAKSPLVVQEIDAASLKSLFERGSGNPRPLVVNFWATWCDPCREEFPDLVKLDQQYQPQGIDFITVSLDDLAIIKTEVPKFLRQMRATMPAYLLNVSDPDQIIKAVDPKWSGALPATFLYDAEGKVVFKHFGRFKPLELRAAIEKQLGGKIVMSQ